MFEGLAFLFTIPFLIGMIPYIILYYIIRNRMRFFTVNEFSSVDTEFPAVIKKAPNEKTLQYAYSFAKNNQFYLSTHRIIFYIQTILRGKNFTRYFDIKTVKNIEITFKNPYGWLILAAIQMLLALISSASACSDKGGSGFSQKQSSGAGLAFFIFFIFSLGAGFYTALWYYLKGYYLIFDNMRISGLFCRSKEGLEEVLRIFDNLKQNSYDVPYSPVDAKSQISSELKSGIRNEYSRDLYTENIPVVSQESKPVIPVSKDVECKSCKSILTLESDDLKFSSFTCPICSTINPIVI